VDMCVEPRASLSGEQQGGNQDAKDEMVHPSDVDMRIRKVSWLGERNRSWPERRGDCRTAEIVAELLRLRRFREPQPHRAQELLPQYDVPGRTGPFCG
jgi:hypothetical protein